MNIELHKESGNNCFFLEILIKNVKRICKLFKLLCQKFLS